MFALLFFSQYPADLGIAHMRCFLQAARETDNAVTPSVAYIDAAHKSALEGLASNDARRRAYEACTVVDLGEPTATGSYALSAQAALTAASAPRRKVEGHGHV